MGAGASRVDGDEISGVVSRMVDAILSKLITASSRKQLSNRQRERAEELIEQYHPRLILSRGRIPQRTAHHEEKRADLELDIERFLESLPI
jgi:hypothetical protein